jgi:hypothetical protein
LDNFFLEICSDLDYEGMVVDINYIYEKKSSNKEIQDQVATLNMDKGKDNIEIKIFEASNDFWEFKLEEFLDILEKAKKRLIEINEEPEE